MRSFNAPAAALALLWLAGNAFAAAEPEKTTTTSACTATSTSGAFYDLRPDMAIKLPADGSKPANKAAPTDDYHARGWDYGSNFTLNICGPVVDPVHNAIGLTDSALTNISAYYVSKGDVYSLGSLSTDLKSRGRKLVLQYSGGSPCGKSSTKGNVLARSNVHQGAAYKYYDDADDHLEAKSSGIVQAKETDAVERRKSATISFLCDTNPVATGAAVSFVGVDPDECSYFFEVRSQHACAGVEPHKPGSVGPGSVFAIILLVAVLVYLGGGIFYQRNVANQRGWRQLPNYSLWSGIGSAFSDFFVIITSSCARFLPNRRGYQYISGSPSRTRHNRDRDAENRLIDQYDEEWDD
ncbi:mannose-6-phosphate receptor binding domain-containing protein [Xylariales sp. PMI_506]|nr:mannose-6-phosphate receptor binding domain-containing protein [Xylariales sp. PMI_506]